MTTNEELRALAEKGTPGPWQVIVTEHPYHARPPYPGGSHKERRIFTAWDHPQLKGPAGVVNSSVGVPDTKGAPAKHMVSIREEDAAYIAAANPERVLALLDEVERLRGALEAYQRIHKSVDADLHTAHQLRGNGASQWMREDDTELRRDFTTAGELARSALTKTEAS